MKSIRTNFPVTGAQVRQVCSEGKAGIAQAFKVPCLCFSWPADPPQMDQCAVKLLSTILVPSACLRLLLYKNQRPGRALSAAGWAHLVPLLLDLLQLGQDGGHAVLVQVTVLLQRAVLQPQVLHLLQVLQAGGWAEQCRVGCAQVRPQGWRPGEANQQVPSRSREQALSPNNKCPPRAGPDFTSLGLSSLICKMVLTNNDTLPANLGLPILAAIGPPALLCFFHSPHTSAT